MISKLKHNYLYIFEQFLILLPFIITIYTTKRYGEVVFADMIYLVTIVTNFCIFSNTVQPKPFFHLKKIVDHNTLIKTILSVNLIGSALSALIIIGIALIYQGIFLYLIFLSIMLFTMSFYFIRYSLLGTELSGYISKVFILSTIIGGILKLACAYYLFDPIWFLLSYVLENIIWCIALYFIIKKEGITDLKINKKDFIFIYKTSFSFFFEILLEKIFTVITTVMIYTMFKAEILIIYLVAQRVNYAQKLLLSAVDNILISYKTFIATKKYLIFSIALSIFYIGFTYTILSYVIIPILGNKFIELSSVYLKLAPLSLIGSFGFYLTQVRLDINSKLGFIIASISSFISGVIALFYVHSINDLIMVLYIQAFFYYISLYLIKR